jgi:hypothetical protein
MRNERTGIDRTGQELMRTELSFKEPAMQELKENRAGVPYHPLDVTRLVKGRVFGLDELEEIMGMQRTSPLWHFGLLRLQRQIARLRQTLGLELLTTRVKRGSLLICADADAAAYNRGMGKRGIRRFARACRRNLAVDATKLSQADASAHGRTLLRQAMMLAAIRSSARAELLNTESPARTTPKMIASPEPNASNPAFDSGP